jgi:hypothetical protein
VKVTKQQLQSDLRIYERARASGVIEIVATEAESDLAPGKIEPVKLSRADLDLKKILAAQKEASERGAEVEIVD